MFALCHSKHACHVISEPWKRQANNFNTKRTVNGDISAKNESFFYKNIQKKSGCVSLRSYIRFHEKYRSL